MDEIAATWASFAIVVLIVLLLSYGFIRYYSDPFDSEPLSTTVSVLILSISALAVLLVPVDAYVSSITQKDLHSLEHDEVKYRIESIQQTYYVLYGCLAGLIFLAVPFASFFFEEDEESPLKKRILTSAMYTTVFLFVLVAMIVSGVLLSLAQKRADDDTHILPWAKDLLASADKRDEALVFMVGCLSVLGLVSYIFYSASGLALFPMSMLRYNSDQYSEDSRGDVQSMLVYCRQMQRGLLSKYHLTSKEMSRKDRTELQRLRRHQQQLEELDQQLAQAPGLRHHISRFLTPLWRALGFLLLCVSFLVVISMAITAFDRVLNGSSSNNSYLLIESSVTNPIDYLLVEFHKFFPLDFVLMGLLVLYVFTSSLHGIVTTGVRILCIPLYKVKPGGTLPQGLLIMATSMAFIMLVLTVQMPTFAPRYSTFTAQTYIDPQTAQDQSCTLDSPLYDLDTGDGECIISRIGQFALRINLSSKFFAILFMYSSFVYVCAFLLTFLISLCRKPRYSSILNDFSDEEEMMEAY